MNTPVLLATVRESVRRGIQAKFLHDGVWVIADLYLLGRARKTGAIIRLAWCIEPALGWKSFRYARIRNFEAMGPIKEFRPDYDPRAPHILLIDTRLPTPMGPGGGQFGSGSTSKNVGRKR